MGNRQLYILLCACMTAFSCGDKEQTGRQQQEVLHEVEYKFPTRALIERTPEDLDTYTIISYRVKDANGTAISKPSEISSNNQRGYYVYLEDGKGYTYFVEDDFLIPVKTADFSVENNKDNLERLDLVADYPYRASNAADPVRNNTYGQKLQAGQYKTAVVYPAAVVLNSYQSQFGPLNVVLPRDIDCPVYAPMPDGLFDMTVKQNLAVYNIDADHKLYITTAKAKAYFYSTPDVDYEIASVKLLNMGTSGWFNPYTGITYPNYGADPNVYSETDDQVIFDPSDWRVSKTKDSVDGEQSLGYVDYTSGGQVSYKTDEADCDAAGEHFAVHYMMDNEAIFATDYRGQSEGGTLSPPVKTMIIRITVNMPVPNSITPTYQEITADIPISLNIERGKLYNFYFDVRSGIFSIKYSISGWETGNSDSDPKDIGETLDYGDFRFEGSGDWVIENKTDGYNDIGGVAP